MDLLVASCRSAAFGGLLVMTVIDYNGKGFWSVDEVLKRYTEYARVFGITQPRELTPLAHWTGDSRWIYPVMDRVIEGIEAGDLGCAELGIEFIQTNDSFPLAGSSNQMSPVPCDARHLPNRKKKEFGDVLSRCSKPDIYLVSSVNMRSWLGNWGYVNSCPESSS